MKTDFRYPKLPGDGWVECSCGRKHWGLEGAAGVLLVHRAPGHNEPTSVLLQHRALWSHQGGTWGIPGGAIATGETSLQGALREAREEAGIDPTDIDIVGTVVLDHRMWSYTTQLAVLRSGLDAPRAFHAGDAESIELRWVPIDEVTDLPLLVAFGQQWPVYRAALARGLARR